MADKRNPLLPRIADKTTGNPLSASDVYEYNAPVVADALRAARDPETWREAARAYADALLAGSVAPGRGVMANPAFREWFGKSVVVGPDGLPLRVYHGTTANFDAFNTSGGQGKTFNTGSFFSSSPDTASTYVTGGTGQVMPVYLNLQSPAVIDAGGANWKQLGKNARVELPQVRVSDQADEDLLAELFGRQAEQNVTKLLKARKTTLGRLFPDEMRYADDYSSTDDMARWARQQGYDGLIIRNVSDHGPSGAMASDKARAPHDLYVAFQPAQIKSAISNRGTYSPIDPRITYSLAPWAVGAGAAAASRNPLSSDE